MGARRAAKGAPASGEEPHMRSGGNAFALALLLAVGSLAGAARAETPDAATLRLDWTALGYHAPFVLAQQRGYYKDQRLDLKILEGKGSSTGIELVANGADTFAFADA